MKTTLTIIYILIINNFAFSQNNETIYALNFGVTTNQVREGEEIEFNKLKPLPNASFIAIKEKGGDLFYVKTTINGQFAYGHYFKFQNKNEEGYNYVRTDGEEIEYIIINYPLDVLASSNKYDEKVIFKLINYRTSFAMLLSF